MDKRSEQLRGRKEKWVKSIGRLLLLPLLQFLLRNDGIGIKVDQREDDDV